MKQLTKISSLLILTLLVFSAANFQNKDVYICTGKYATKYHYKKDCRGLKNCKGEIKEVKLSKAKELERTLCGWED